MLSQLLTKPLALPTLPTPTTESLQRCCQQLEALGVGFTLTPDQTRIQEFRLRHTAESWHEACFGKRESYAQGLLNQCYLRGGVLKSHELSDIVDDLGPRFETQTGDVWGALQEIWTTASQHCMCFAAPSTKTDTERVIDTVRLGLDRVRLAMLDPQDAAGDVLAIRRLLPAVKSLKRTLKALCPEPLRGFGVLDASGAVVETRFGVGVFRTREEANGYAEAVGRDLRVCPVAVSLDHGVIVLE